MSAQDAFGAPAGKGARRPSAVGYWLGGLVMVAAVVLAVVWAITKIGGFSDAVDRLQRVPVPGQATVALPGGNLAVYYEGPGGTDATVPPLHVQVTPAGGDGPPLRLSGYSGSVSYSVGGHAGVSTASLHGVKAGRYRVVVSGAEVSGADLAIGKGVGSKIVAGILGGLGIFFGGLLAGGALITVTAVRRGNASKP